MNYMTHYGWMLDHCRTAVYYVHAGIDTQDQGSTPVSVSEWQLMSWSTDDEPIESITGAPWHEDTPSGDSMDLQKLDLTQTPDPTLTQADRNAVEVENMGAKAYGNASGLYNNYHYYSQQWHQ